MVMIFISVSQQNWIYVPECTCNKSFFNLIRPDHKTKKTIERLLTWLGDSGYEGNPFDLFEEIYLDQIDLQTGAIETDQYQVALSHEGKCGRKEYKRVEIDDYQYEEVGNHEADEVKKFSDGYSIR